MVGRKAGQEATLQLAQSIGLCGDDLKKPSVGVVDALASPQDLKGRMLVQRNEERTWLGEGHKPTPVPWLQCGGEVFIAADHATPALANSTCNA